MRVGFESLPPNAAPLTSYTESGMTLTAAKMHGKPERNPADNWVDVFSYNFTNGVTQAPLLSFSSPVSHIALKEYVAVMSSVTIFADAAGTQSLGTFLTTHTNTSGADFAFKSDMPFRSFTYTASYSNGAASSSYMIDDLRYANAVPEPSALLAGLGAVTGYFGLQRRRRA